MALEIPVEFVNEKSPYRVWSSPLGICFLTDSDVLYEVGFVEDYMVCASGVYQFFISVREGTPVVRDDKVRMTVLAILEAFFRCTDFALVYICDTSDGKQGVRNRLFEMWFNEYAQKDQYLFLRGELMVEGVLYYANGIIPSNSTWRKDFCISFERFMTAMKGK